MTAGRAAVVVAGVIGVLSLSACGSSSGVATPSSALPSTGGSGLELTADPASCAPATSGVTCTVRVWYANASESSLPLDAGMTRLVSADGTVYRAVPTVRVPSSQVLRPGTRVAVDWSLALPKGSTLAGVTWIGVEGESASVALVVATATPAPSPSATPSATPKPTPAPKPTPTATQKPAPAPTRTRTSQPAPSSPPPATGSIG